MQTRRHCQLSHRCTQPSPPHIMSGPNACDFYPYFLWLCNANRQRPLALQQRQFGPRVCMWCRRGHACALVRVSQLYVDSCTGGILHNVGPHFTGLESLTLSARADIHPLKSMVPFSSRWVSLRSRLRRHKVCMHGVTVIRICSPMCCTPFFRRSAHVEVSSNVTCRLMADMFIFVAWSARSTDVWHDMIRCGSAWRCMSAGLQWLKALLCSLSHKQQAPLQDADGCVDMLTELAHLPAFQECNLNSLSYTLAMQHV